MLALDAGICDTVLVCYGSNQRTKAGKLVSSASYKNSKDFTNAVVSSYREMGALVPKLGLKQN